MDCEAVEIVLKTFTGFLKSRYLDFQEHSASNSPQALTESKSDTRDKHDDGARESGHSC